MSNLSDFLKSGVEAAGIVSVADSQAIWVDVDENVGIGTATPDKKLAVLVSSNNDGFQLVNSGGEELFKLVRAGGSSDAAQFSLFDNNGVNENIRLHSDGDNWLNSGNVGIGTVNPSTLLNLLDGTLRVTTSGSHSFDLYTATGISKIANTGAQPIAFYTSNTNERMRIAGNGNVGIGKTNPGTLLDIESTSNNPVIIVNSTIAGDGSKKGGEIQLKMQSSTSTPQYTNDITGQLSFIGQGTDASVINGYIRSIVQTGNTNRNTMASSLEFAVDRTGYTGANVNSPDLVIKENGYVDCKRGLDVGTFDTGGATDGIRIAASNTIFESSQKSTIAEHHMRFWNPNGQVGSITTTNSATAFVTSSDYRLKENVTPMTGAIDRVKLLKPSNFNFTTNPSTTVDGFIAHEAQTVVPESVIGTKDEIDDESNPKYQGIDQSKLVPLLTAALQEEITKNEVLIALLVSKSVITQIEADAI